MQNRLNLAPFSPVPKRRLSHRLSRNVVCPETSPRNVAMLEISPIAAKINFLSRQITELSQRNRQFLLGLKAKF